MREALIAPDFFTRSYLAASSNMTSKVTSKGPAFLLRITLAKSRSVAMRLTPRQSRGRGVWPSVPHLFDRHREAFARVFERHQVIHREAIRRSERNAERRERIRHVARGVADAGIARVLERAAHEHRNARRE